jgi:hypothetical protein
MSAEPIRSMTCSCCGSGCRCRQWHNRDTGFGLCPRCGITLALKYSPQEMVRLYGTPGVHYSIAEGDGGRFTDLGDPATGEIFTEAQVEHRVRMLYRDDLCHEAIVTIARDELRRRRRERDELLELLAEASAALPDAWLAVKAKVPRELIERIDTALAKHGRFAMPVDKKD